MVERFFEAWFRSWVRTTPWEFLHYKSFSSLYPLLNWLPRQSFENNSSNYDPFLCVWWWLVPSISRRFYLLQLQDNQQVHRREIRAVSKRREWSEQTKHHRHSCPLLLLLHQSFLSWVGKPFKSFMLISCIGLFRSIAPTHFLLDIFP